MNSKAKIGFFSTLQSLQTPSLIGKLPFIQHCISLRFNWGSIEFNALVEAGKISDGRIFSDCLYPNFIDWMNEILQSK